ncbi:MAG: hypothetical protein QM767_05305 [Anaeromyxobacter sp.]
MRLVVAGDHHREGRAVAARRHACGCGSGGGAPDQARSGDLHQPGARSAQPAGQRLRGAVPGAGIEAARGPVERRAQGEAVERERRRPAACGPLQREREPLRVEVRRACGRQVRVGRQRRQQRPEPARLRLDGGGEEHQQLAAGQRGASGGGARRPERRRVPVEDQAGQPLQRGGRLVGGPVVHHDGLGREAAGLLEEPHQQREGVIPAALDGDHQRDEGGTGGGLGHGLRG